MYSRLGLNSLFSVCLMLLSQVSYSDLASKVPNTMVTDVTTVLSQQIAHQEILNMAGSYDVVYEFKEIYPLVTDYVLRDKKITRGKDVVLVIENTPNKISLQHLLMAPNGEVIKHWRQDWEFQPIQAWQYMGNYHWGKIIYRPEQVSGKWLQTVWNADDSPRYAALGQWRKQAGVLFWQSELTARPLPRREYSKRQDYDLIVGINRHIINAVGWIQEEDNFKYQSVEQRSLVKEIGVVRYIQNPLDLQSAHTYWQKHQAYWQQVRLLWQQALSKNSQIALNSPEKQNIAPEQAHFLKFLEQAQQLSEQEHSSEKLYQAAKQLINEELIIGHIP